MTLSERLFSGQVLDSSTGLYYYGHGRYYDPTIGRYISPDPYLDAPFSSQRLDRYNFGFNNPLRYKRSEALPDSTVDLARGTLVADAVSPASLTTSFSHSLTAGTMGLLSGIATGGKLAYTGLARYQEARRLWAGGFETVISGVYPGPRALTKVRVLGTQALKSRLGLKTHLTHAGIDYGGYVTRMARPSALGEFAWALKRADFWAVNIGLAVGLNVLDYGWGSKADVGIGSTEFYAAVTVDIGLGVASAGSGAVIAYAFWAVAMLVAPEFAGPALVVGYFSGALAFNAASLYFGWHDVGVRRLAPLYGSLGGREQGIPYPNSPLLR